MTLRQVLDIIWRRWLLVTVTTLLVVGAAIAYVQLSPKVYESTSTDAGSCGCRSARRASSCNWRMR